MRHAHANVSAVGPCAPRLSLNRCFISRSLPNPHLRENVKRLTQASAECRVRALTQTIKSNRTSYMLDFTP